jgi:hypothetical protein
MASEYIDNTEDGSGLYPTKIPGYEDAADIQEALRLYHYGSNIIPTVDSLTDPNGINSKSIAGNFKILKNADEQLQLEIDNEIDNRISGDSTIQNEINDLLIDIENSSGLKTAILSKDSSFTLALEDAGKTTILNNNLEINITVPSNSSVSIPVGYQYNFLAYTSILATVVPAEGVTISSKNAQMHIDSQYGHGTLIKVDTNSWIFFGDISETASSPAVPVSVTAEDVGSNRAFDNGAASVFFSLPELSPIATSFTVAASTGQTATGTSSPIVVTGISTGASPTFTVIATNEQGSSPESDPTSAVTITTVPAKVATPTATSTEVNKDVVTWSAPATGGKAISGYRVKSSDGPVYNVGNVLAYEVAETGGTSQTYQVLAINENGDGVYSESSTSVTTTSPFFPFFPPSFGPFFPFFPPSFGPFFPFFPPFFPPLFGVGPFGM